MKLQKCLGMGLVFAVALLAGPSLCWAQDSDLSRVRLFVFEAQTKDICREIETQLRGMGYTQPDNTFRSGGPDACERMAGQDQMVFTAVNREIPSGEGYRPERLFTLSKKSSAAPQKIENIEDVIDLVANFDVVTSRALQAIIPDSASTQSTLKIRRFTQNLGPEGIESGAYYGVLMEVKFK